MGFHLIDKGQPQLARLARVRWPGGTLLERGSHRFPLGFYAGGISLFTLLATFGFVRQSAALEVQGWSLG